MGLTWEEAEVAALHRSEWRQHVTQYVSMDVGLTKDKASSSVSASKFSLSGLAYGPDRALP